MPRFYDKVLKLKGLTIASVKFLQHTWPVSESWLYFHSHVTCKNDMVLLRMQTTGLEINGRIFNKTRTGSRTNMDKFGQLWTVWRTQQGRKRRSFYRTFTRESLFKKIFVKNVFFSAKLKQNMSTICSHAVGSYGRFVWCTSSRIKTVVFVLLRLQRKMKLKGRAEISIHDKNNFRALDLRGSPQLHIFFQTDRPLKISVR